MPVTLRRAWVLALVLFVVLLLAAVVLSFLISPHLFAVYTAQPLVCGGLDGPCS